MKNTKITNLEELSDDMNNNYYSQNEIEEKPEVKITQDVPKKRGRPRKNANLEKPINPKSFNFVPSKKDEDIILHLPNDSSDSENDNIKTTLLSISDYSIENNDKKDLNLIKELKKKDEIIEKLNNIIAELSVNNTVKPVKLPDTVNFINIKDGKTCIIDKTDIACWWDSCTFDTAPCFLPERYYEDTYYVFGCFCSPNCALAYNINLNDHRSHTRTSLLKKLYNNMYNNNIIAAYQPEILTKYGGNVTIEDYRNNNNMIKKDIKISIPPMIYTNSNIKITIKENKN
jgi:hypothetical protein